jgi:hypothetical protein
MNESIAATRVGTAIITYRSGRGPCDRCGREIQIGKNKGLHLCRSCRHDSTYIALVKGNA